MLEIHPFWSGTVEIVANQVSEEIPVLNGVRQGDLISPRFFTATVQEVVSKCPDRGESNEYRRR